MSRESLPKESSRIIPMSQEQQASMMQLITLLVLVQARLLPTLSNHDLDDIPDSIKDLIVSATEVVANLRSFLPQEVLKHGPEESFKLLRFVSTLYQSKDTLQ